jgi:putative redox protein
LKAVIETTGAVGARANLDGHELVFDQPANVPGGQDRGPSPLDVMAVAVGACAHYFAAAFLYGRKLPVDGLRVEVEAEKTRDPVPRFGRLRLQVCLPPGVSAAHREGIERAVKHCPAYGTLQHPPEVTLEFTEGKVEVKASAA